MWIKTVDGMLVNLDQVGYIAVELVEGGQYAVVGTMWGDPLPWYLSTHDTNEAAHKAVNTLFTHLTVRGRTVYSQREDHSLP